VSAATDCDRYVGGTLREGENTPFAYNQTEIKMWQCYKGDAEEGTIFLPPDYNEQAKKPFYARFRLSYPQNDYYPYLNQAFHSTAACQEKGLNRIMPKDSNSIFYQMIRHFKLNNIPGYSNIWIGAKRRTTDSLFYWDDGTLFDSMYFDNTGSGDCITLEVDDNGVISLRTTGCDQFGSIYCENI